MGLRFVTNDIIGAGAMLPLALPVAQGFIGGYLTYNNSSQIVTNYLDVTQDSTVAGSPAITHNATTFTGNIDYIQTPHKDTGEFTIFAVAKSGEIESGRQAHVVGDFGATGVAGFSLYFTGLNINLSSTYSSGIKQAVRTKNGDIALYVARSSNDRLDLIEKTRNLTASTNVSESRKTSGRSIRVGSANGVVLANQSCEISLVLIYDRILNDVEVDSVTLVIRKLMSTIGVQV